MIIVACSAMDGCWHAASATLSRPPGRAGTGVPPSFGRATSLITFSTSSSTRSVDMHAAAWSDAMNFVVTDMCHINGEFTPTTHSTQLSWLWAECNDVVSIVTSRFCAQTTRCLPAWLSSWVELSWVASVIRVQIYDATQRSSSFGLSRIGVVGVKWP